MSGYRSATSPELLTVLKRWQEYQNPEDAAFLADQLPSVLEDVARVKAGFMTLRQKVRQLEAEMESYRHTRILADFDDSQMH